MTTTLIPETATGIVPAEPKAIALPQQPRLTLLPSAHEYKVYLELADQFIASGFLPTSITKPAQALAIMLTGRELGLPPMLALRSLHVIEGKPGMSAELILARFRQAGGKYRWTTTTDHEAEIQAIAPGNPIEWVETFRFTMEEAQQAGVTDKKNWKRYPAAMLRARCATLMVRAIAPEVSAGLYDPDELGAVTTETGEVEWPEPESRPTRSARATVVNDTVETPTRSPNAHVNAADPILPLPEMLKESIPLSDPRCKLGSVVKFLWLISNKPEAAKQYVKIIPKAYAAMKTKIEDATFDELNVIGDWIAGDEESTKLFREFVKPIRERAEVLAGRLDDQANSAVESKQGVAPEPVSAEDTEAELADAIDVEDFSVNG